jgi:hypothetical protein
LLNECKVLYCYDRLSAMMDVARLCGCRVVYLGELSQEVLHHYETGMNGITYKNSEKEVLNSYSFRYHYNRMIEQFGRDLDSFIRDTQKGNTLTEL